MIAAGRVLFAPALADGLLEHYVAWRRESLDVQRAYQRWSDCRWAERGLHHAGYLAALDREEKAACVYADQIDWVRRAAA